MRQQDCEEIKRIEQWKWSEMRDYQLVVSVPTPRSSDNASSINNTTPPSTSVQTAESEGIQTLPAMEVEGKKDGGGGEPEKTGPAPSVGFGELFRFADGLDYALMTIGTIGAIVHGSSLPLFLRFFADLVNSFGSNADNVEKMTQEVLKVCYIVFVCVFREEKRNRGVDVFVICCNGLRLFAVCILLSCCGSCDLGFFMGR